MIKKSISFLLSFSLIWTSGGVLDAASAMPDVFAGASNLPQFQLMPPGQLGRIVDYYTAAAKSEEPKANTEKLDKPLVILIQDLHAHYGVQKNISGLLEFLADKLGKQQANASLSALRSSLPYALAVEGASGPIDSSVMALFPDEKIKMAASDYLMREGELTGPEYFAIKRGIPNLLVGAENEKYYTVHRDLFRKTLADRQAMVQTLKSLQYDINELPRYVFHKNQVLWEFQKKVDAYENSRISTHDFIGLLVSQAPGINLKKEFPTLASFSENSRFGTMDQIRSATAEFLTQTQNRLTGEEKNDLKLLAKNRGTTTYYLYLRELVYKKQLFLAVPPELAQYLEYIHTAQTMGMEKVIHEAKELAFRIKLQLARGSGEASDLIQVQHDLDLLLRLADLQATEYEVRDFAPRLNQFVALTKTLLKYKGPFDEQRVRRLISSSIDFYVMALLRNKPMMENTLALIGNRSEEIGRGKEKNVTPNTSHLAPHVAVLVAGGFHTVQMTNLLREKNISYLVISPLALQVTAADHDLYVKRLNGQLLTEEEIYAQAQDKHSVLRQVARTYGLEKTRSWPLAQNVASLWPFSKDVSQNKYSLDMGLKGSVLFPVEHQTATALTALRNNKVEELPAAVPPHSLRPIIEIVDGKQTINLEALKELLSRVTESARARIKPGMTRQQIEQVITNDLQNKQIDRRRGLGRVASKGSDVIGDITSLSDLYINLRKGHLGMNAHEWLHVLQVEALLKAGVPTSLCEDRRFEKLFEMPAYQFGFEVSRQTFTFWDLYVNAFGWLVYQLGLGPAASNLSLVLDRSGKRIAKDAIKFHQDENGHLNISVWRQGAEETALGRGFLPFINVPAKWAYSQIFGKSDRTQKVYDDYVGPFIEEILFTGIPLLLHVSLPWLGAIRIAFIVLHIFAGQAPPEAQGRKLTWYEKITVPVVVSLIALSLTWFAGPTLSNLAIAAIVGKSGVGHSYTNLSTPNLSALTGRFFQKAVLRSNNRDTQSIWNRTSFDINDFEDLGPLVMSDQELPGLRRMRDRATGEAFIYKSDVEAENSFLVQALGDVQQKQLDSKSAPFQIRLITIQANGAAENHFIFQVPDQPISGLPLILKKFELPGLAALKLPSLAKLLTPIDVPKFDFAKYLPLIAKTDFTGLNLPQLGDSILKVPPTEPTVSKKLPDELDYKKPKRFQTHPPSNSMDVTADYLANLTVPTAMLAEGDMERLLAQEVERLIKEHPEAKVELKKALEEIRQFQHSETHDRLQVVARIMAAVVGKIKEEDPDQYVLHFARDLGLNMAVQTALNQLSDGTEPLAGGAFYLNTPMMGTVYPELNALINHTGVDSADLAAVVDDWFETRMSQQDSEFLALERSARISLEQMGVFERDKIVLMDTGFAGTMPWYVYGLIRYYDRHGTGPHRKENRDLQVLLVKSTNDTRQVGTNDIRDEDHEVLAADSNILQMIHNNDNMLHILEATGNARQHPIRFSKTEQKIVAETPANRLQFFFIRQMFLDMAVAQHLQIVGVKKLADQGVTYDQLPQILSAPINGKAAWRQINLDELSKWSATLQKTDFLLLEKKILKSDTFKFDLKHYSSLPKSFWQTPITPINEIKPIKIDFGENATLINPQIFENAKVMKALSPIKLIGQLPVFALPKKQPRGVLAAAVTAGAILLAGALYFAGAITTNEANILGAGGILAGFGVLIGALRYGAYLQRIRNGDFTNAGPAARTEDEIRAQMQELFGAEGTAGMGVTIADEILELMPADFANNFAGALAAANNQSVENIKNRFEAGYYYDLSSKRLFINSAARSGSTEIGPRNQRYVNNALYDGLADHLFILNQAVVSPDFQFGLVLAHEAGKRAFERSSFHVFGSMEDRVAELVGNLFELWYLIGGPKYLTPSALNRLVKMMGVMALGLTFQGTMTTVNVTTGLPTPVLGISLSAMGALIIHFFQGAIPRAILQLITDPFQPIFRLITAIRSGRAKELLLKPLAAIRRSASKDSNRKMAVVVLLSAIAGFLFGIAAYYGLDFILHWVSQQGQNALPHFSSGLDVGGGTLGAMAVGSVGGGRRLLILPVNPAAGPAAVDRRQPPVDPEGSLRDASARVSDPQEDYVALPGVERLVAASDQVWINIRQALGDGIDEQQAQTLLDQAGDPLIAAQAIAREGDNDGQTHFRFDLKKDQAGQWVLVYDPNKHEPGTYQRPVSTLPDTYREGSQFYADNPKIYQRELRRLAALNQDDQIRQMSDRLNISMEEATLRRAVELFFAPYRERQDLFKPDFVDRHINTGRQKSIRTRAVTAIKKAVEDVAQEKGKPLGHLLGFLNTHLKLAVEEAETAVSIAFGVGLEEAIVANGIDVVMHFLHNLAQPAAVLTRQDKPESASSPRKRLPMAVTYTSAFSDAVSGLDPPERTALMATLYDRLNEGKTFKRMVGALVGFSEFRDIRGSGSRLVFSIDPRNNSIHLIAYYPKKINETNSVRFAREIQTAAESTLNPQKDAARITRLNNWLYNDVPRSGRISIEDFNIVSDLIRRSFFDPVQLTNTLYEFLAPDIKGVTLIERNLKIPLYGSAMKPVLITAIQEIQTVLRESRGDLDEASKLWVGSGERVSPALLAKAQSVLKAWMGAEGRMLHFVDEELKKDPESNDPPRWDLIGHLFSGLSIYDLEDSIRQAVEAWARQQPESEFGRQRIEEAYILLQPHTDTLPPFRSDVLQSLIAGESPALTLPDTYRTGRQFYADNPKIYERELRRLAALNQDDQIRQMSGRLNISMEEATLRRAIELFFSPIRERQDLFKPGFVDNHMNTGRQKTVRNRTVAAIKKAVEDVAQGKGKPLDHLLGFLNTHVKLAVEEAETAVSIAFGVGLEEAIVANGIDVVMHFLHNLAHPEAALTVDSPAIRPSLDGSLTRRSFGLAGIGALTAMALQGQSRSASEKQLDKALAQVRQDLNELPEDLREGYISRIKAGFLSLEKNKAAGDVRQMLRVIGNASVPLIEKGYIAYIQPDVQGEQVVMRGTLAHLKPNSEKQTFGDHDVTVRHIQKVTGYRGIFGRAYGLTIPVAFPRMALLFDDQIQNASSKLENFRRNPKSPLALADLKSILAFDDPIVQTVVLETFTGIPDGHLWEALAGRFTLHEMLHDWFGQIVDDKEKPAWLGAMAFSKNPQFDLLYLAALLEGQEEQVGEGSANLKAARGIIRDLAERLKNDHVLSLEEVEGVFGKGFLASPAVFLTGKQVLAFIQVLREKNVSNPVLRRTAGALYEVQFGNLPTLKEIAVALDSREQSPVARFATGSEQVAQNSLVVGIHRASSPLKPMTLGADEKTGSQFSLWRYILYTAFLGNPVHEILGHWLSAAFSVWEVDSTEAFGTDPHVALKPFKKRLGNDGMLLASRHARRFYLSGLIANYVVAVLGTALSIWSFVGHFNDGPGWIGLGVIAGLVALSNWIVGIAASKLERPGQLTDRQLAHHYGRIAREVKNSKYQFLGSRDKQGRTSYKDYSPTIPSMPSDPAYYRANSPLQPGNSRANRATSRAGTVSLTGAGAAAVIMLVGAITHHGFWIVPTLIWGVVGITAWRFWRHRLQFNLLEPEQQAAYVRRFGLWRGGILVMGLLLAVNLAAAIVKDPSASNTISVGLYTAFATLELVHNFVKQLAYFKGSKSGDGGTIGAQLKTLDLRMTKKTTPIDAKTAGIFSNNNSVSDVLTKAKELGLFVHHESLEDTHLIADAMAARLNTFKNEDVARELGAIVSAVPEQDIDQFYKDDLQRFLMGGGIAFLNPEVASLLIGQAFKAFSQEQDPTLSINRYMRFVQMISNVREWNESYLDHVEEELVADLKAQSSGHSRVPATAIPEDLRGSPFFQQDAQDAAFYHVQTDFDQAVAREESGPRKQQLIRVQKILLFQQKATRSAVELLLKRQKSARLTQRLAAELKTASEAPYHSLLVGLLLKAPDFASFVAADQLRELVEASLTQYSAATDDPDAQTTLIGNLANLARQPSVLPIGRMIFDSLRDHLDKASSRASGASLMHGFFGDSDLGAFTQGRVNKRMDSFERPLEVLIELAKTGFRSSIEEDHQLASEILEYVLNISQSSEASGLNIESEVISQVSSLAAEGNESTLNWFTAKLELESPDEEALKSALSPETSDTAILQLLEQLKPEQHGRSAYLLMMRHHARRDLMATIAKSDALPTAYRLYAFMNFSTDLLQAGTWTEKDETDWKALFSLLAPLSHDLIEDKLGDTQRQVKELFTNPLLQDEEAKVYGMAALLSEGRAPFINQTTPVLKTIDVISKGKVVPYWNNATSAFRLGAAGLDEARDPAAHYFQTLVHELKHVILAEHMGFVVLTLPQGALHELLADVNTMAFSNRYGISMQEWQELLNYRERAEAISKLDHQFDEPHDGGRAQLQVLLDTLALHGLTLDPEKLLLAGDDVLGNQANHDRHFSDFMTLILKAYVRRVIPELGFEEQVQAAKGQTDLFSANIDQRILSVEAIEAILNPLIVAQGTQPSAPTAKAVQTLEMDHLLSHGISEKEKADIFAEATDAHNFRSSDIVRHLVRLVGLTPGASEPFYSLRSSLEQALKGHPEFETPLLPGKKKATTSDLVLEAFKLIDEGSATQFNVQGWLKGGDHYFIGEGRADSFTLADDFFQASLLVDLRAEGALYVALQSAVARTYPEAARPLAFKALLAKVSPLFFDPVHFDGQITHYVARMTRDRSLDVTPEEDAGQVPQGRMWMLRNWPRWLANLTETLMLTGLWFAGLYFAGDHTTITPIVISAIMSLFHVLGRTPSLPKGASGSFSQRWLGGHVTFGAARTERYGVSNGLRLGALFMIFSAPFIALQHSLLTSGDMHASLLAGFVLFAVALSAVFSHVMHFPIWNQRVAESSVGQWLGLPKGGGSEMDEAPAKPARPLHRDYTGAFETISPRNEIRLLREIQNNLTRITMQGVPREIDSVQYWQHAFRLAGIQNPGELKYRRLIDQLVAGINEIRGAPFHKKDVPPTIFKKQLEAKIEARIGQLKAQIYQQGYNNRTPLVPDQAQQSSDAAEPLFPLTNGRLIVTTSSQEQANNELLKALRRRITVTDAESVEQAEAAENYLDDLFDGLLDRPLSVYELDLFTFFVTGPGRNIPIEFQAARPHSPNEGGFGSWTDDNDDGRVSVLFSYNFQNAQQKDPRSSLNILKHEMSHTYDGLRELWGQSHNELTNYTAPARQHVLAFREFRANLWAFDGDIAKAYSTTLWAYNAIQNTVDIFGDPAQLNPEQVFRFLWLATQQVNHQMYDSNEEDALVKRQLWNQVQESLKAQIPDMRTEGSPIEEWAQGIINGDGDDTIQPLSARLQNTHSNSLPDVLSEYLKLSSISLAQLAYLFLFARHEVDMGFDKSRRVEKSMAFRVRLLIAREAAAFLPSTDRPNIERILVGHFDASIEELQQLLSQIADNPEMPAHVNRRFQALKDAWENQQEKLSYRLSQSTNESETIRLARETLSTQTEFKNWLAGTGQRLSLKEKLRAVDTVSLPEDKKTGLRLAIFEVHFQDRYGIALQIPLQGLTPEDRIPRDSMGQTSVLVDPNELEEIFPHLLKVDQILQTIPYSFSGMSPEIQTIILVKGDGFIPSYGQRNASFTYNVASGSSWCDLLHSHITVALPNNDEDVSRFENAVVHEIGHSTGDRDRGMVPPYDPHLLRSWIDRYSFPLTEAQNQTLVELERAWEQTLSLSGDLDPLSKDRILISGSQLLYQIVETLFNERKIQYENIRKQFISEFAKKSFPEMLAELKLEPMDQELEPVHDAYLQPFIQGTVAPDSYDYVKDLFAASPHLAGDLAKVKSQQDVNTFMITAYQYFQYKTDSQFSVLSSNKIGNFDDWMWTDYIFRERRDRRTVSSILDRNEPAVEFIPEYWRMFLRQNSTLKEADPTVYELFRIIYGAPRTHPDVSSSAVTQNSTLTLPETTAVVRGLFRKLGWKERPWIISLFAALFVAPWFEIKDTLEKSFISRHVNAHSYQTFFRSAGLLFIWTAMVAAPMIFGLGESHFAHAPAGLAIGAAILTAPATAPMGNIVAHFLYNVFGLAINATLTLDTDPSAVAQELLGSIDPSERLPIATVALQWSHSVLAVQAVLAALKNMGVRQTSIPAGTTDLLQAAIDQAQESWSGQDVDWKSIEKAVRRISTNEQSTFERSARLDTQLQDIVLSIETWMLRLSAVENQGYNQMAARGLNNTIINELRADEVKPYVAFSALIINTCLKSPDHVSRETSTNPVGDMILWAMGHGVSLPAHFDESRLELVLRSVTGLSSTASGGEFALTLQKLIARRLALIQARLGKGYSADDLASTRRLALIRRMASEAEVERANAVAAIGENRISDFEIFWNRPANNQRSLGNAVTMYLNTLTLGKPAATETVSPGSVAQPPKADIVLGYSIDRIRSFLEADLLGRSTVDAHIEDFFKYLHANEETINLGRKDIGDLTAEFVERLHLPPANAHEAGLTSPVIANAPEVTTPKDLAMERIAAYHQAVIALIIGRLKERYNFSPRSTDKTVTTLLADFLHLNPDPPKYSYELEPNVIQFLTSNDKKVRKLAGGMIINKEWYRAPARWVEWVLALLAAAGTVTAMAPGHDPLAILASIFVAGGVSYLALLAGHAIFNPNALKGMNGRGVQAMMWDSSGVAMAGAAALSGLIAGMPVLALLAGIVTFALSADLLIKHKNLNFGSSYRRGNGSLANETTLGSLLRWLANHHIWMSKKYLTLQMGNIHFAAVATAEASTGAAALEDPALSMSPNDAALNQQREDLVKNEINLSA